MKNPDRGPLEDPTTVWESYSCCVMFLQQESQEYPGSGHTWWGHGACSGQSTGEPAQEGPAHDLLPTSHSLTPRHGLQTGRSPACGKTQSPVLCPHLQAISPGTVSSSVKWGHKDRPSAPQTGGRFEKCADVFCRVPFKFRN